MVRRGRKSKRSGKLSWRDVRALLVGIVGWLWRLLCLVRYLNPLFHLAPRHRQFYAQSTDGSGLIKPSLFERVVNTFQNDETTRMRLLEWCQLQIPTCTVTNLTMCWQDGIALCALMESTCPGVCPRYDLLKPQHKVNNCRLGLKLANKHLCIPLSIITPEDIALSQSETKMRRLISLIKWASQRKNTPYKKQKTRLQNESSQAPAAMRTSAKGSGLVAGVVNRLCKFNVSTPPNESLHLQIEITGPQGYACDELITSRFNRISGNALVAAAAMEWKKAQYTKSVTKAAKLFKSMLKTKDGGDGKEDTEMDDAECNKKIPFDYQCVGECQIAISYIPRSAGKHTINILWHSKHVRGSPFSPTIEESVEKLNDNAAGKVRQKKLPTGKQNRLQYYPNESFPSMDEGDEMSSEEFQSSINLRRFAAANNIQYRLSKQATITRRRVLKKVMTKAGKEIIIHEATDTSRENSQESSSRQESVDTCSDIQVSTSKESKMDKLESVAQIVERIRLSPSRQIIEKTIMNENSTNDIARVSPAMFNDRDQQQHAQAYQSDKNGKSILQDNTDNVHTTSSNNVKSNEPEIDQSRPIFKDIPIQQNMNTIKDDGNAINQNKMETLSTKVQITHNSETRFKPLSVSLIKEFAFTIVEEIVNSAIEAASKSRNNSMNTSETSDESFECPSDSFRPVMQAPSQLIRSVDIHRPVVSNRHSTEDKKQSVKMTHSYHITNGSHSGINMVDIGEKESGSVSKVVAENENELEKQMSRNIDSELGVEMYNQAANKQKTITYKGDPKVDLTKDEAMSLRHLQSDSLRKSCYYMSQHPPIQESSSSSLSMFSTLDGDTEVGKTPKSSPDKRVALAQQKPRDKLRQSLSLPTLSRKWKAFEIDSDEEDDFNAEEMRILAAQNKHKRYTLGSSDLSETLEQFALLHPLSSRDNSKGSLEESPFDSGNISEVHARRSENNKGNDSSLTISRRGSYSDMVFGRQIINLQKVSEEDIDKADSTDDRSNARCSVGTQNGSSTIIESDKKSVLKPSVIHHKSSFCKKRTKKKKVPTATLR